MTTNHTPEPIFGLPLTAHGNLIYETTGYMRSVAVCVNDDEASRIVACVNACAGIPTADLENSQSRQGEQLTGYGKACAERDRLREINAELLAALKTAMRHAAEAMPSDERAVFENGAGPE